MPQQILTFLNIALLGLLWGSIFKQQLPGRIHEWVESCPETLV